MIEIARNILYINCPSGIAGDMFIAACIDLGVSIDFLKSELKKLNIDKFSLTVKDVYKKGIKAKYFEVKADDKYEECHLSDINKLIEQSALSENVKELSKKIFLNLGTAEAVVHNTVIENIHFHEVGAIDSIIDIIGAAICLEKLCMLGMLGIDEIYCSKIPMPSGKIVCEHGEISNPAPATLKLLKNFAAYKVPITKEIITPTGAAILKTILKTIVKQQKDFEEFKKEMNEKKFRIIKQGYGAGAMDLEKPNVLHLLLFSQE